MRALRRNLGPVLALGLINRGLQGRRVDSRHPAGRIRHQRTVRDQGDCLVTAAFGRRAEIPDDERVAAGKLEARRATPANDQAPG